jgi:hypothetical protein
VSPQAKIVAGGLTFVVVTLVVASIFGLRDVWRGMVAGAADPAHVRAVAAKIARFGVPAGYELVSGADLLFSQTVTLQSLDGTSPQMIVLESAPNADSQLAERGLLEGLNLKGFGRCAHLAKVGSESFVTPGGAAILRHSDCADKGNAMRVESGAVRGGTASVIIFAVGTADDWESRPLRELLASLHPGPAAAGQR